MIQAHIYRDSSGIVQGFLLEGHAGFAKSGSDIVCAAASILVINTINSIEAFTLESVEFYSNEKKGEIRCSFPNRRSAAADKDADILIKAMVLGLQSLEQEYGKYINVSEEAPQ